jgi:hypothetical protein
MFLKNLKHFTTLFLHGAEIKTEEKEPNGKIVNKMKLFR